MRDAVGAVFLQEISPPMTAGMEFTGAIINHQPIPPGGRAEQGQIRTGQRPTEGGRVVLTP